MRTPTRPERRAAVVAEAAAVAAAQVWLGRRLARATRHATDVEDLELHVPAQRRPERPT